MPLMFDNVFHVTKNKRNSNNVCYLVFVIGFIEMRAVYQNFNLGYNPTLLAKVFKNYR